MIGTSTSSSPSRRRSAGVLFVALPLALLSACQTHPRLEGQNVQVYHEGRVAVTNPTDVAIAPVEVLAPVGNIPTEALRDAAQRALVRKRYSPLSLAQVDNSIVGIEPASYRAGALREDAVLELVVHAWDASLWEMGHVISIDIEARLVEPESVEASGLLWGARLSQQFDFTGQARSTTSDAGAIEVACQAVLEELLSRLPARDPEAGLRAGSPN